MPKPRRDITVAKEAKEAVDSVTCKLERTVTYFLSSITERVEHYEAMMRMCLPADRPLPSLVYPDGTEGDAPPRDAPPNNRDALLASLRALKTESRALLKVVDHASEWLLLNVQLEKGVSASLATVSQGLQTFREVLRGQVQLEADFLARLATVERLAETAPDTAARAAWVDSLDRSCWDELEMGWGKLVRNTYGMYTILSENLADVMPPPPRRAFSY